MFRKLSLPSLSCPEPPYILNVNSTLCYVLSFLFVVLFKMVAQTITRASRSDDTDKPVNSDNHRHGFFANESKDSEHFESGRAKSFKARKEPEGERCNRSGYYSRYTARPVAARVASRVATRVDKQLHGGKPQPAARKYSTRSLLNAILKLTYSRSLLPNSH